MNCESRCRKFGEIGLWGNLELTKSQQCGMREGGLSNRKKQFFQEEQNSPVFYYKSIINLLSDKM